jgi:hypothetical protein
VGENSTENEAQFVAVLGYYLVRSVLDLLNPGTTVKPQDIIAQIETHKGDY